MMVRSAAAEIRERPAYGIHEAAHYLGLSPSTLQSWALGRRYPTTSGMRHWSPLFDVADKRNRRLSFINLVEASVLAAVRRDHGVRMPAVRAALDYVRERLNVPRPLADQKFVTDGVGLFVERYGRLIDASRQGQQVLQGMLDAALRRIDRAEPGGVPIRLYPNRSPNDRERAHYVAFDPAIAFGRPALVGAGVPIAAIAERFRAGDTMTFLAQDYGVGSDAIEEAIRLADNLRAA